MRVLVVAGLVAIGLCLATADVQDKDLVEKTIKEATAIQDEKLRMAFVQGAQSKKISRENQKYSKNSDEIGRISMIYRNALSILINTHSMDREIALKYLMEALPHQCVKQAITCDPAKKYRTVDGTCNNLKNPRWGSVDAPQNRLIKPAYSDDDQPRRAVGGGDLPNARKISTAIHQGNGENFAPDFTHMVAQFGQFLDHDITLTPVPILGCCQNSSVGECYVIDVPPSDEFYLGLETCLDFVRSAASCETISGGREQMNGITAYIDASVVYGSDETTSGQLRTFRDGKLLENKKNPKFLPWKSETIEGDTGNATVHAGDVRANEMPGLTVMHTLFLREHNNIAEQFAYLTNWTDEQIYQETRRIVAAELQQITYNEFLLTILGEETMKHYKLELPPPTNSFTTYNSSVDATVFNAFSTAAYRFGHTLVNGLIKMMLGLVEVHKYNVRDHYSKSEVLIEERNKTHGYDLILNGLIQQESQSADAEIHKDMTNYLFHSPSFLGTDLAARNIQRGRDHGLPSYNEFRQHCNLTKLDKNVQPEEFSSEAWEKLLAIYNNVTDDFDMYTAGLSETPVKGGLSGPTFACLQGIQFQRFKDGDRFFFTHVDQVGSFKREQLEELRNRRLGDIICENSVLKETPRNVFHKVSDGNPMIPCSDSSRLLNIKLFIGETENVDEDENSGTNFVATFTLVVVASVVSLFNIL